MERALQAEMVEHLGHGKNEPVENVAGNTRNGRSRKTLKGDFGKLPIEIPRDRHGAFEPQFIPKHQTRWTGFDDKILSLYARGMTVREIQGHLEEMYGTPVSPALISSVTDAVLDEVNAWQSRPLDALYPIVYLDCIHVKSARCRGGAGQGRVSGARRQPGRLARNCWASGWPRPRARSSGCRW